MKNIYARELSLLVIGAIITIIGSHLYNEIYTKPKETQNRAIEDAKKENEEIIERLKLLIGSLNGLDQSTINDSIVDSNKVRALETINDIQKQKHYEKWQAIIGNSSAINDKSSNREMLTRVKLNERIESISHGDAFNDYKIKYIWKVLTSQPGSRMFDLTSSTKDGSISLATKPAYIKEHDRNKNTKGLILNNFPKWIEEDYPVYYFEHQQALETRSKEFFFPEPNEITKSKETNL